MVIAIENQEKLKMKILLKRFLKHIKAKYIVIVISNILVNYYQPIKTLQYHTILFIKHLLEQGFYHQNVSVLLKKGKPKQKRKNKKC